MDYSESLSHSGWEYKHQVVFILTCRRRLLRGQLRRHAGEVFRTLAEHRGSRFLERQVAPPRRREFGTRVTGGFAGARQRIQGGRV